jgi:hypothetical protein
MEERKTRLKPLVYSSNKYTSGSQNTTQQMLLLKALQVTQDPKKLREMIGVRTVAEVYRTLDKLSMRKEYHEALARSGISFDFIVEGLKGIAVAAEKDDTKLKAFQTLLKSVGMDTYKESDGGGSGSWEEVLLKKLDDAKGESAQIEGPKEYDVKVPEIPESVKKIQEEERQMLSSIYDSKQQ